MDRPDECAHPLGRGSPVRSRGGWRMIARKQPTIRGWVLVSACALSALASAPARAGAEEAKAGQPTAEAVLRQVADFFKKARSVAVEVERVQEVGARSIQQSFSVAFQRPNRFAYRDKGGTGITVICDGKRLVTDAPALKKYTPHEGDP